MAGDIYPAEAVELPVLGSVYPQESWSHCLA